MFKFGNLQVRPGMWIYSDDPLCTLYAKVCDNKCADGGIMVYLYNTAYPDNHEAGWLPERYAHHFRVVPTSAQTQFDDTVHGQAANQFFARAERCGFL